MPPAEAGALSVPIRPAAAPTQRRAAIRRPHVSRPGLRGPRSDRATARGRAAARCSSGPPARGSGGGSAGRREAQDGSAAAGRRKRNGLALRASARRWRQPASSAARGQPADSLFIAGQGGGPNERAEPSRPNTRVIARGAAHLARDVTRMMARRRVRCTRVLGRPTGDEPIRRKGCAGGTRNLDESRH